MRISTELKPLIDALSAGNEKLESEKAKNQVKKEGLEKEFKQLRKSMKESQDGKTIETRLVELTNQK